MSTTPNSSSSSSTIAAVSASPSADSALTVAMLVQLGICLPGLIANGFLVFVILKNRKLRTGCCFILILLLAICDCLSEFSLITVPTVFYFGGITIPLLTCFFIEIYGPYAHLNMLMLMLLIGVDRFIAVIFPLIYKKLHVDHKWKYMFVLLSLPSVPVFFVIYQCYLYSLSDASRQVFCIPTDIGGPVGLRYNYQLTLVYNIGTFLVYTTIWLLFKLKVVKLLQNSVEQRLLRTLYILMLLTFCCWMPTAVFGSYLLPYISADFQTQMTVNRLVQQLNKLVQALNGVILYAYSSEYRSAMQKELQWMLKKVYINSSNQIQINNNNCSNNQNIAITNNVVSMSISNVAAPASGMHQRMCAYFNK